MGSLHCFAVDVEGSAIESNTTTTVLVDKGTDFPLYVSVHRKRASECAPLYIYVYRETTTTLLLLRV